MIAKEVLMLSASSMGEVPDEKTILEILSRDRKLAPASPNPTLALTAMLNSKSVYPSTLPYLIKMKDSPVLYRKIERRQPPISGPPILVTRYYVRELVAQCLFSLGIPFIAKRDEKKFIDENGEDNIVFELEIIIDQYEINAAGINLPRTTDAPPEEGEKEIKATTAPSPQAGDDGNQREE
jgi:hypothetical protein